MLDRSFFEEQLDALVSAFARETAPAKAVLQITLRGGGTVKVEERLATGDTWIAFRLPAAKGGQKRTQQVVVPYDAIAAITFTAETEDGRIGFTQG